MTRLARIVSGLNVAPMLAAIEPAMWDAITARQDHAGSAHRDTRAIFLRGPADVHDIHDGIESSPYPGADSLRMRKAFEDLIEAIPLELVELGRVMVVGLKPGGHVDRHTDEGAYAARFSRFHVALQSDAGNTFECDGESVHMRPGECWWFDHRRPHEVRNASALERIHLIVDARISALYAPGEQ